MTVRSVVRRASEKIPDITGRLMSWLVFVVATWDIQMQVCLTDVDLTVYMTKCSPYMNTHTTPGLVYNCCR